MMSDNRRGTMLAVFCAVAALFIGIVWTLGQTPGQGPTPPPIHFPHIGGSKQERPQVETPTEGQVYIVLWFDTEDYILPQSDDAAKRIAVFLTQQGVPATFKVVGEKARVLQQRQRQDVISAIAQHDIGYHSNTHSQHPTVAEYESNLDWQTGVEEFNRRERPGYDDVAHIFRKTPVAYGQPGSSWAPQPYQALAKVGGTGLSWMKASRWDCAAGRFFMAACSIFSILKRAGNCAPTKPGPISIPPKLDSRMPTSPCRREKGAASSAPCSILANLCTNSFGMRRISPMAPTPRAISGSSRR